MYLSDVLAESRSRVSTATGTVTRTAADLAGSGAPEATGQAVHPARPTPGRATPALAAVILAFAALGGLTAMRVIFRGAIS